MVVTATDMPRTDRRLNPLLARAIGLAILVSIPVWWQGLHAWANSQHGYLEVGQIGASPFFWLAWMALFGTLITFDARRGSRRTSGNVILLAAFLVVAGALALGNVAAALPNGISLPGMALAVLSAAQVVLVTAGLATR
jgi:hypothetical protein